MPAPVDQVSISLRLLLSRQEDPAGEAALKALLFKHRHLICATLERAAQAPQSDRTATPHKVAEDRRGPETCERYDPATEGSA